LVFGNMIFRNLVFGNLVFGNLVFDTKSTISKMSKGRQDGE
jgi:hypothetical protein